jgi:hypothetical protein
MNYFYFSSFLPRACMEKPILNDKDKYPDNEVLTQFLGTTIKTWDSFLELLKTDYPQISTEWRFYNDGKSWLFKVTKKTKTICWVSVWKKLFKVTFYFNSKADEIINSSPLDDEIKEKYLHEKNIGKIKPITLEIKKKSQLKTIKELIEIKEKIK